MRFENAAKPRRTVMRGNGSEVHGTLIVKGALHQDYQEDQSTGEWVTRTYSTTFAIEDRRFARIPSRGERVNIGPVEAPLDYWAEVVDVEHMPDGNLRVMAQLDVEAQREEVEVNEVSEEYEVLAVYGHASQIESELVAEVRTPLSELDDDQG